MPDPIKSRELPEQEFNGIRQRVIDAAPDGLDEDGFNKYFGPAMEQALAQAEFTSAPMEGGAIGRFVGGAAEMFNPVAIVKGLYQAGRHPIDTAGAMVGAQVDQFKQAGDAYDRMKNARGAPGKVANASEAAGHLVAGALPILGPMAASAGQRIQSGDVAGGLGTSAGILAPLGAAKVVNAAKAVIPTRAGETAAAALESGAQKRMTNTITPMVGANKVRFGGIAEEVAPRLRTEPGMGAVSVESFQGKVGARLAQAEQVLDEAADARLSARTFKTEPVVDALEERLASITAEATKASETPLKPAQPFSGPLTKKAEPPAQPIGSDVVPGPNEARAAVLRQAIAEIKQLGPVASYESIRRIRQAYDGPAKAVYNPSMTQDFLKAQGGKFGAADVAGALREHLGQWDPTTAAANTEYSFWRKADDVLAALEETERTRPKVGRRLMAQLTGATTGGAVAGGAGAVAGLVLGPMVEAAVGSGATTQIQMARQMTRLAAAIRKGDIGNVNAAAFNLRQQTRAAAKKLTPAGAVGVDKATSSSPVPAPAGSGR